MKTLVLSLLAAFTVCCSAQIKVASLHPLMTDIAQQVGGSRVTVVELVKPGDDVHHFEPSARQLTEMRGCQLIIASGMNLEAYLDKLRDSVGGVPVLEVGKSIPSIKVEPGNEIFFDDDDHIVGGVDPHWWHSADNMQRAADIIGEAFIKADAAGKDIYKANIKTTRKKLGDLKKWAQQQIAVIPRSDRKLVTGHAAFSYFCKEFGFKLMPVLGFNRQDEASAKYAAEAVKIIRENKIRAAFPEDQANPKVLQEIVRETKVILGDALVADGTSMEVHTFEKMLKHNVEAIVKALK